MTSINNTSLNFAFKVVIGAAVGVLVIRQRRRNSSAFLHKTPGGDGGGNQAGPGSSAGFMMGYATPRGDKNAVPAVVDKDTVISCGEISPTSPKPLY